MSLDHAEHQRRLFSGRSDVEIKDVFPFIGAMVAVEQGLAECKRECSISEVAAAGGGRGDPQSAVRSGESAGPDEREDYGG